MMHLCQFGQNLAIGSEDRVQTRLFRFDPGDLINQGKVNKFNYSLRPPNDVHEPV